MDFDWKKVVSTVAPVIGTALGGPLGGMAVKAIGDALGLSGATEETVAQALQGAKPEDLLKLKQADQQFAEHMKALDVDLERISAGDRESARKRQVDTKDRTPAVLAYIIIGGFFAFSAGLLYGFIWMPDAMAKIPSQGWVIIGTVYGYLAAEAKQAAAYFFGSTSGSKDKDSTIAEIAKA